MINKLFYIFIILLFSNNIYPKDIAEDIFDLKISKEDFIKILKEQKIMNVIITFEKTTWFGDDIYTWAKKENVNLDELFNELKKSFDDKIKKYKKINFKLLNDKSENQEAIIIILNLENIFHVIAPMAFGISKYSINIYGTKDDQIIANGIIKSSKNIYGVRNELFRTSGIGLSESLIDIFDKYLK